MVVDSVDKKIWEMISDVPLVSKFVAVISTVLNIILPGFGTTVSACAAQDTLVSKTQLGIALL